jgi:hypothetical protein
MFFFNSFSSLRTLLKGLNSWNLIRKKCPLGIGFTYNDFGIGRYIAGFEVMALTFFILRRKILNVNNTNVTIIKIRFKSFFPRLFMGHHLQDLKHSNSLGLQKGF